VSSLVNSVTSSRDLPIVTSGFVGSIGLVLDISGAFFLAQSFILKRREAVTREASDYFSGNPYRLRSAVFQANEAWVGFAYLLLGFTGQFLGESTLLTNGVDRFPLLIVLIGVAQLGLVFAIARTVNRERSRRVVAKHFGQLILEQLAGEDEATDRSASFCDFYAPALDLKRGKGEADQAFIDRTVVQITKYRSG
jgi:hypothetical protein